MKTSNMKHLVSTGRMPILAFCVSTMLVAKADNVYLSATDGGSENSFEFGTHFGGNPPSPGNTYIVNKGFTVNLRTREIPGNDTTCTNVVFGGDSLVLGDDNGAGQILSKSINNWTNSANFVFHDGLIQPAQGGNDTTESVSASTTGTFGGYALIESPAAKPFRFAGSYSRGVRLALALSGAESTGLMVCRNFTSSDDTEKKAGHFSVFLDGDNAQYFGRWTVDGYGVTENYGTGVAPNDPKWRVKLVLADETKLGGNPTERQDDGLKLRHSGTVELAASANDRILDFGNRTVQLVQGGGRFEHNGTGKVTLKGVFSGTDNLTLQTVGTVVFAGEWVGSGNLVVSNQVLHVSPEAKWTGSGRMVAQGTGSIVYDADGLLELDEWPTGLEGPLPISRPDLFTDPTNGPSRAAVVTIPTSAKVVTPADFTTVNDGGLGGDTTLAQIAFEVETNGEGLQTVYMRRPAYLWMTLPYDANEYSTAQYIQDQNGKPGTASKAWSDTQKVHEGGDYLVYAAHAVRMADLQIATFDGSSLTLVGTSNQRAELTLKGKTNEVAKIFAGNYTDISFKNYSGNTRQVLTGSLYATGKRIGSDDGVRIRGSSGANGDLRYPDNGVRVSEVASDIAGDADLRISSYDAHVAHIVLSGDNSAFTGTIRVYPYNDNNTTTLVLSDSNSLGGNPESFKEMGLALINGCRLFAGVDISVDQPNRGLYIQKKASFDVAEGASLTLGLPATYYRGTTSAGETTVVKEGAGTLVMAGKTKGGAPDTRYFITAGVFEQKDLLAFERIKTLAFYPGTTMVVPYQTESENGLLLKGNPTNTERPLVLANGAETLNVRIDIPEGTELRRHFRMPIATVPKTAADSSMSVSGEASPVAITSASQITVASPAKSYITKVVAEEVLIDNVAYTRFVADCHIPGFVLVVR